MQVGGVARDSDRRLVDGGDFLVVKGTLGIGEDGKDLTSGRLSAVVGPGLELLIFKPTGP